jgi:release factor glutamine methyltransferase
MNAKTERDPSLVAANQPDLAVRRLLQAGVARLQSAQTADSPRLEAELLLCHVLGVGRAWLFAHDDAVVPAPQCAAFRALLERRVGGEPLAYLTGEREFYGLNLAVGPGVLIPRHDTEVLVEQALARLPQACAGKSPAIEVLDLGTGSGAIALALAHVRPDLCVCAIDASAAALSVARTNAQRLGLGRVQFLEGDWFAPVAGRRFDLVVSNPPYIEDQDPHLAQGDLRFEPRSALASGGDGLDDIRRIVDAAGAHLKPEAWLLLEHGHLQGAAVRSLLREAGLCEVFSAADLEGRERVSGGRLRPTPVAQADSS